MPERKRAYQSYPATPDPPVMEHRRNSRVFGVCVVVALVLQVAAVVILFVLVLNLKAHRDAEVADRAKAINDAMCSVLNEFHAANSPDFQHARALLHCTTPTA